MFEASLKLGGLLSKIWMLRDLVFFIFSSLCNSTDKFYICLKVDEDFQIQMSTILNAVKGREVVSNN